jgi:ribulose-phosphate 3-epimerase
MNCLAPSILSADFVNLERDIRVCDEAGAQYIHIDVMDGHFVPPITIGADVVRAIRNITDKILDVHLMVEDPDRLIKSFADAGADIITVHEEACVHLDRTVHMIKDAGVMVGVALNPATSPETLRYIMPELDMVLLMSVNPGYGGQSFIPYTLDKIEAVRAMIDNAGNTRTDIEVDGGVKLSNIDSVLNAGANIIVAGSAVFNGNIGDNVRAFLERM